MSILSNIFASTKADTEGYIDSSTGYMFGGSSSLSGAKVTPQTSMTLSQYYACIRNISEDTAKLPIGIYKTDPGTGQKKLVLDDNITRLLNVIPNPDMSPITCRETIQALVLGWGNGYAEIVRNPNTGNITQLIPIHSSRVTIKRNEKTNRIEYDIFAVQTTFFTKQTKQTTLDQVDMFHIKALSEDGLYGLSVAHIGKTSIGVGISTQNYGAAFYSNNTQLGTIIKHPATLTKEAHERLVASVDKNRKGSSNAFKSMVLEEGMDIGSTAIPPSDAQFIETRNFQVEDIARWFRMPLSKLQTGEGKKSVKNLEEENIAYHTDTLLPWIIRWEQEIKIKLLGVTTKKSAKFDTKELLRGDSKAQVERAKGYSMIGGQTIDETRIDAGRNPVGGEIGETLFIQGAMTTVQQVIDGEAKENKPAVKDLGQKNQNPGSESGASSDSAAPAFNAMVKNVLATIWNKENKAFDRAFSKAQKTDFSLGTWAEEFYPTLTVEAFQKLEPVVSSFAMVVGCGKEKHKTALAQLNIAIENTFRLNPKRSERCNSIELSDIMVILENMEKI